MWIIIFYYYYLYVIITVLDQHVQLLFIILNGICSVINTVNIFQTIPNNSYVITISDEASQELAPFSTHPSNLEIISIFKAIAVKCWNIYCLTGMLSKKSMQTWKESKHFFPFILYSICLQNFLKTRDG